MHATHVANVGRRGRTVGLVLLACVAALVAALPGPARAAKAEKEGKITKVVLDVSALQPGKPATLAVVFDVKPGFHAQSSVSRDYFADSIPFTATVSENPAMTFGAPLFPPGKLIPAELTGQLSVYEGQVVVRIPIQVKADAPLGPTKVGGKLGFQICDDAGKCLAPDKEAFSIDTEIVAADKPVEPANEDVFRQATRAGAAAPAGAGGAKVVNPDAPAYSLFGGLGIAFLVGIMFNAVPCVLPVLPLKGLQFYEASQHSRRRSLAFGVAFGLGVVASFAALGLVVVVLKAFKWGELFSNPWFSAVLALILAAMALNMFGLFTINVPGRMYAFSPRHDTYFGNVLFGILTAALSTPCTFGLFVSVLGWALTQTPAVGMLAICTVGAGMASPYVLLSAFPEVARKFPRTGPWAELTKQFMGFLLLGVAAFFAQQWIGKLVGGNERVWWVIFGIIAAGAAFLVARAFHYGKTRTAPAVAIVIALLLVVPSFLVARKLTIKPYQWQEYSPQLLAQAQAGNEVVLVEFTASWCANCHTIEALYINADDVRRDVSKYNVRMVKADLSATTAPGWDLLRGLGGEGVPLTAVYAPGLKEPVLLTGFYGVGPLRDAIAKAAQGKPAAAAGGEGKTAMAQ